MKGGIPLIKTLLPIILVRLPLMIPTITINNVLDGSHGFVYNNDELCVGYSNSVETNCIGRLCDRQRVSYWDHSRGCGYYCMNFNGSSFSIQHHIEFQTTDKNRAMTIFHHQVSAKLYLSCYIPCTTRLYCIYLTDVMFNLTYYVEAYVD